MRTLTEATPFEQFVGSYGQTWRTGVISDHVSLMLQGGHFVHYSGNGAIHVVESGTGRTARVLCSEIVEVATEDGPISGRCGNPLFTFGLECARHGVTA